MIQRLSILFMFLTPFITSTSFSKVIFYQSTPAGWAETTPNIMTNNTINLMISGQPFDHVKICSPFIPLVEKLGSEDSTHICVYWEQEADEADTAEQVADWLSQFRLINEGKEINLIGYCIGGRVGILVNEAVPINHLVLLTTPFYARNIMTMIKNGFFIGRTYNLLGDVAKNILHEKEISTPTLVVQGILGSDEPMMPSSVIFSAFGGSYGIHDGIIPLYPEEDLLSHFSSPKSKHIIVDSNHNHIVSRAAEEISEFLYQSI